MINTDFPLINAVLQKKQEGRIFNIEKSLFIIHKSGFSYLKLGEENDINSLLNFFSKEKQLPQYFHIYDPPVKLVEGIKNDMRFGIKYRKRIQFRFEEKKVISSFRRNIEKSFTLKDIDNNIYDRLKIFDLKLDNHFWQSKDDFLKNGYGKVILNNDHPVSICYSSCVVNGVSEIDIATLPHYQGKGLAKAVAEAFIEESIKNGIQANWDCFEENVPSLKTANNLGFIKVKEYWFLSVFNKTKYEK